MGAFECSKISPTESTEVFTISVASTATLSEPRKDVESQIMKTGWRKHVWWRVGIDLPIVIILALLIGLFELGVIPNHKAGFYCNSTILSYPYTGDTVTADVLMATFFLLPLVAILLTEYIFVEPEFPQSRIRLTGQNTLYLYGVFLYGFILNMGIVELMKGVVGNPRPDFFALCDPDTAKTCTGSEFVSTFTCTKNQYSSWLQLDSYRSFPSGHSSLSVYCGFFIAWYLQRRAFNWSHRTILLVPVLQLACISYAAVCSLTRITDHRHHWWDVLAGTGIGIATLLYAVTLSSNFSTDRNVSDVKSQESRRTERTLLYDERRRTTE